MRLKIEDLRFKILDISISRGLVISIALFTGAIAFAQNANDSALNRSVTVERDFQPVIQAAGKVSTKPEIVETTIDPAPMEYSEYTAEVTPGTTFHPLLSQPTRFEPGKLYHGYIRGALGHPNTLFDFGYHLDDGKKSILDVYAHHKAIWGLNALSKTNVGLNFTHPFSTCDLYFGVDGGNIFYHKYGHFYDYAYYAEKNRDFGMWEKNKVAYANREPFTDFHKTSLWTAEAFIGVKANAKQDVQYQVQTGYKLYSKPGAVSEHQIRTRGAFDWHGEEHHVGANLYLQNNFIQLGSLAEEIDESQYNSRHNIRFEPYYAYDGKRVQLHVGVNIDMNIGKGQNALSGIERLSFAPSPNVHLEAQIAKKWLTIYADATGKLSTGTLEAFMEGNRYRLIHAGIVSHHMSPYTPVDAEVGFHIRPYRDLLLEIHGGYAVQLSQRTLIANTDNTSCHALGHELHAGDFSSTYSDLTRGKVGGQINYHLQDKLRIHFYGDYYFWKVLKNEPTKYQFDNPCQAIIDLNEGTNTTVYDRPNWELGVRIDGNIDKHWSLYSDNKFIGDRLALAKDGEHILRPTLDLNLGVAYNMWVGKSQKSETGMTLRPEPQPNLTFFFQLNNWLHRKNEVYYGYRSQGINCLAGVTFRF